MSFWNRLRGLVGRRQIEERAPSHNASPRLIVEQLPISLQLQRIGGSLTPIAVSRIIREADLGRMWQLMDLANDARQKDCTLQSVLGTREMALSGLDWDVTPPEGATRLKDKKAAEFIEEALKQAVAPDSAPSEIVGFPDLVKHIVGGQYFGYAVGETLFGKDGGYVVPTGWSCIAPRRFAFDPDTGQLLQWDIAAGQRKGIDLLAAYPGKFIQFHSRVNGDIACREGLVRVLMWAALFRNWDIADWLKLAELAWKPWRTGKYQKGASKEDKDGLLSMLEQMTTSFVGIFPETATPEIHWPPSATGTGRTTHEALADFMGAEMAKAVLGQTLTTEQGKVGSQALGRVHNEVRKDILEADARAIASVLRRHLIGPLVRLNFGDGVAIPEFKFLTKDPVDLMAFSTGVANLVNAGLKVPGSWVREQIGMPEPDEGDEDVLGGALEVDTSGLDAPTDGPPPPGAPPPPPPPPKAAPSFAEKNAAFLADVKDYRQLGFDTGPDTVARLAELHDVPVPTLTT